MESLEDEKYYVCLGMKNHGGSFVKGLGEALLHADHFNRIKIKTTWPRLWERYLEIGKILYKRGER